MQTRNSLKKRGSISVSTLLKELSQLFKRKLQPEQNLHLVNLDCQVKPLKGLKTRTGTVRLLTGTEMVMVVAFSGILCLPLVHCCPAPLKEGCGNVKFDFHTGQAQELATVSHN